MTSPYAVLNCPMDPADNDASAETVRDYLVSLLHALWDEGENFSGYRPFGNSGWEHDLYKPLIREGLITGTFDEDGYIENFDRAAADKLITDAIKALAQPVQPEDVVLAAERDLANTRLFVEQTTRSYREMIAQREAAVAYARHFAEQK